MIQTAHNSSPKEDPEAKFNWEIQIELQGETVNRKVDNCTKKGINLLVRKLTSGDTIVETRNSGNTVIGYPPHAIRRVIAVRA